MLKNTVNHLQERKTQTQKNNKKKNYPATRMY